LDEPFSNLDANLRRYLREELKNILRSTQATAILVTHDIQDALAVGDLLGVVREGHLEQLSPPHELVMHPVNQYVRDFVAGAGQDGHRDHEVCPHCKMPLDVRLDMGPKGTRMEPPATH